MGKNNKEILVDLLKQHKELGISEQIDYEKFYLYKDSVGDNIGDKSTETGKIGDKKEAILSFIADNPNVKASVIADYVGLKASRTRDYLAELVKEGKITTDGANKNRTYKMK